MNTHAERVAAAVPGNMKVVALLHDAIEDGHIESVDAADALNPIRARALFLLTRNTNDTYAEYIANISIAAMYSRLHGDKVAGAIARRIKIADLLDNLTRPEGPPRPSLAKRYRDALHTLEYRGDIPGHDD